MSNNTILYGNFDNGKEQSIIKQYQSLIAKDKELTFLRSCAQTGLTPEVIAEDMYSITMTYVHGPSLLLVLEEVWHGHKPTADGERLLQALIDWFKSVVALFGDRDRLPVLEDAHLKNYIVDAKTERVVGVDFEHWHWGTLDEGIGIVLAYLCTYNESTTPIAKGLYDWFLCEAIKQLGLSERAVIAYAAEYRHYLLLRRRTAPHRRDTTAVILIGGHSRRMGQPKEQLLAETHSFVETIIYQLQSFDHIALSIRPDQTSHTSLPKWVDCFPEHGPMGALYTALERAETSWVLLVACDMPSLRESLLFRMLEEQSQWADCIVPAYGGHNHVLTGLYHKRMLPMVAELMQAGKLRMQELLNNANTHYVQLDDTLGKQLDNINDPEEYEKWKRGCAL